MAETNVSLNYDCRDESTRAVFMNLSLSFDNPSTYEFKKNLNTWLKAINVDLEVVEKNNEHTKLGS